MIKKFFTCIIKKLLGNFMKKVKIYTDGGARGNPGPSACGVVILDENDKLLKLDGKFLGHATNNQAEYKGVLVALKMASIMNVESIEFYLDSELMVKQLNGEYRVKSSNLKPIKKDIDTLLSNFKEVTFTHVRRKYNTHADKIVNIVLDALHRR